MIQNWATPWPHYSNSPRLARDTVVLGPSAALSGDPTPITSVNNTSQSVPQPSFLTIHSFSTFTPGVLEWPTPRTRLLCGRDRENCGPSKIVNQDHLPIKWALFERRCRDNSVLFSTPTVKQFQTLHVSVSRSNHAPFDH